MMDDMDWRDYAECARVGASAELFIPPDDETKSQLAARNKQAKAICARCEVQAPCLEFALRMREPGVWGNTTARERREMRETAAAIA